MPNNYITNDGQNWWKWGDPEKSYQLKKDFPKLVQYLENKWKTQLTESFLLPDRIASVKPSSLKIEEWQKVFFSLKPQQISITNHDRIKYALGKSYRNALRILTNEEIKTPDVVLFPESSHEVQFILEQANKQAMRISTFGGGTNVTGSLDIEGSQITCCINMQKMNKLLHMDTVSQTAVFEAGILGPEIETIVNKQGYTLGHFPQSFEFSSLGGWLATRSAGQESGKYGKIEDMVLGIKAATPIGTIEQFSYQRHACGIDVFPLFVGSEGSLGIITEVKVKIHKLPKEHNWVAAIFKTYEEGISTLRELVQLGIHPAISRLSDVQETQMLSLLKNEEAKGLKKNIQSLMKSYLKHSGYDKPCLLLLQFPVHTIIDNVSSQIAKKIIKQNKGFELPSSSASNWHKNRFSLPYMRETLIQHRILIDMFETITYWNNITPLYHQIKENLKSKSDYFDKGGIVFCHVSHIYETGASLYFTFMAPQEYQKEIKQWERLKQLVSDTIVQKGGAISHHHGIGKDHQKWYLQQTNVEVQKLLLALKKYLDPNSIMNPGKLYDHVYNNALYDTIKL